MMRSMWVAAGLVAAVAALVALAEDARAQTPYVTIASSGPLDQIDLGRELSCQVHHILDGPRQWYPPGTRPGDCGWFVETAGTLYAPNFAQHGGTATGGIGVYTPFTPVSQTGVLGAGAASNPYRVTTTANAGTLLQLVSTDLYVLGREYYTTWVNITNTSPGPVSLILYRAGDCYLGGSDSGYGAVAISAPGSIACTINPNNLPAGRFEEMVPLTPGSTYYHATYSAVWSWIGGGTMFPNTCACAALLDNGEGLSWQFLLTAGQTVRVGTITSFALDPNPTAEFTYALGPCSDLTVVFTDWSTGGTSGTVTQSTWDWGDGTVTTYNPWQGTVSHTYPASGTYNVNLTVWNGAGRTDQYQQTIVLAPCPNPPVADFTCAAPNLPFKRIIFTDLSTAPLGPVVAWRWSFGDGGTSTAQNPYHDYAAAGIYMVTLNVTSNSGHTHQVAKPCEAITNDPPVIDPIPDQVVFEGDTITFIVTATDPEDDPLQFGSNLLGVGNLGATFHPGTQVFRWQTGPGMAGVYTGIGFEVHDAWNSDATTAHIVVRLLPNAPAPGNADQDGDGIPDRHDDCPSVPNPAQRGGCDPAQAPAAPPAGSSSDDIDGGLDGDGLAGDGAAAIDSDGDGVADAKDNCVSVANHDQSDIDRDGDGDACDVDIDDDQHVQRDPLGRLVDNCPYVSNPDQADSVGDGVGDACRGDRDGDGVPDGVDVCPWVRDPLQADADRDGIGDMCEGGPLDGPHLVPRPGPGAAPEDPQDPGPRLRDSSPARAQGMVAAGILAAAVAVAGLATGAWRRRRTR